MEDSGLYEASGLKEIFEPETAVEKACLHPDLDVRELRPGIIAIKGDCMDFLVLCGDNEFDLLCDDPPYGINRDGGETGKNWKLHKKKNWDKERPPAQYWKLAFRATENQIVFGANYFTQFLPPSMGWIFWDKGQKLTMSDGELIFTSFERALRSYVINRCKIQEKGGGNHPTGKPVSLYRKIFREYIPEGTTILDCHGGEGPSAIEAFYANCPIVIIEKDPEYFEAMCKRILNETAQADLFQPHTQALEPPKQSTLFDL